MIRHQASGRTLTYGQVAAAANRLPDPGNVKLKAPGEFRLIGKPMARLDSADKVAGTTKFGIDVSVPGMRVATVKACPTFDGSGASDVIAVAVVALFTVCVTATEVLVAKLASPL